MPDAKVTRQTSYITVSFGFKDLLWAILELN